MKTWDIQKTQFKVADFINWAKNNELNLSPMFQRRAVWSKGAKSYLLDTILRGLPVPPIILRDLPPDIKTFQSIREVVDGQQRLRTLLTFIAPQIVNDFDSVRDKFTIIKAHNRDLSGKAFLELPDKFKRQILDYQFMVHIFPSNTDDRDILEIFARMNATGTKLNNQELRNAEFFGEFKTVAFSLAAEHLNVWRTWRLFSEASIARMSEVEFTSELMILLIEGISENNKSVIDAIYRKFDETFPNRNEAVKRLRYILAVLNDNYLETHPDILESKGIVYPLFAAVYDKAFGLGAPLTSAKAKTVSKDAIKKIGEHAQKLVDQTAPSTVILAVEARSSQAKNRRVIANYLKSVK